MGTPKSEDPQSFHLQLMIEPWKVREIDRAAEGRAVTRAEQIRRWIDDGLKKEKRL